MIPNTLTHAKELIARHTTALNDSSAVSNEELNAFLVEAPMLEQAITAARSIATTRLISGQSLADWELYAGKLVR